MHWGCYEFVLDSHALELRVLGLIFGVGDCVTESFSNVIEDGQFSGEGYGPGVGQTGKHREDRAAVLVAARRSTESQRSGRKRDFKFRNRARFTKLR